MEFNHVSVMLDECMQGLNIVPDGIYVDGTVGGGGHAKKILESLSDGGRLVAIDQDEDALHFAMKELANYSGQVSFIHNNFANIQIILDELNIDKIDGMLMDLGVSSYQLDEGDRGFSYMHEAPLDMRMDRRKSISAYEVVNRYSEKELSNIIYEYGEERWAKRIAEFIVTQRQVHPIETTFELVSVIKKAIPKGARENGPHPAKRTFQAIRIEVNGELKILEQAVNDIVDRLKPGGRICVITFHSLEDRIIKTAFKKLEKPCTCPPDFPVCICNKVQQVKIITRKPLISSDAELEENHRSRSAKLRVAEKIDI